nr:MAG TPA: hypothetical protein [Caudoviricetes sp.]
MIHILGKQSTKFTQNEQFAQTCVTHFGLFSALQLPEMSIL